MILRAFLAALRKDLRLIARDRVGLVFLTVAPMIVITVAGFSLASLYGTDPRGQTAYILPLVDEDGGAIGEAIRKRLAEEPAVELLPMPDRASALARLGQRDAGTALVIPAGTSEGIAAGRLAKLVLLTDPVKYLEIANVRALVQELRHGIEEEARKQAASERTGLEAAARKQRAEIEALAKNTSRQLEAYRDQLRQVMERASDENRQKIETRISAELEPVRSFLAELGRSKKALEDWLAEARAKAGKLADRMPPPPALPSVPPEVTQLARASSAELVTRLAGDLKPPAIELAELPALRLPPVPAANGPRFPGSLDIEETSVTGAPRRLNTFDQNVPGFSVTFLLLGMLLGVSLAILDEREWGTLHRLQAMPPPLSVTLLAKLASRLLVGTGQMILLFALGWAAFGISLGPEPWALLLPTVGIVFAATAFGLVVAGLTDSREAVLPIGSIVIVTMAAVGGCWWPIDLEPRWMRQVALGFPTTWVMAAYNDLMIRRQPLAAALPPTGVLMLYGVCYLLVGLWLFRRRVLRGL